MKIRLNEDYYFWCCEWCDSENLVLWARRRTEPIAGPAIDRCNCRTRMAL